MAELLKSPMTIDQEAIKAARQTVEWHEYWNCAFTPSPVAIPSHPTDEMRVKIAFALLAAEAELTEVNASRGLDAMRCCNGHPKIAYRSSEVTGGNCPLCTTLAAVERADARIRDAGQLHLEGGSDAANGFYGSLYIIREEMRR